MFPVELLAGSKNFRKACRGMSPRFGVWANICGTDLVRDRDGTVYVLEDNLRVPSGVSYMLENRMLMKSVFPEIFAANRILPVDGYTAALYDMLAALSPRMEDRPVIALLTPGIFNSAYFEHSYLAQQTGAQLVQGSDLLVGSDDIVYMKSIAGLRRVDVIYRRIDDDFLDPEAFRSDSVLGVPGPDARLGQGQCGDSQCAGRRRGRRQGGLHLRAEDHQVLPGPGPHPPQRAELPVQRREGARVRARQPGQAGGEAGQRIRRLWLADRPARHASRARRSVPRMCAPIRAAGWRSPC